MSGSASKCEFLPLPSGRNEAEFFRSFGSIEKIKGNLGFGSIIRLEDGLKRMYEDMVSETRMV
jgi:nucleoside-diphosphate-sugar epimerase